MSMKEYVATCLTSLLLILVISYLFYRSVIAIFVLSPLIVCSIKYNKIRLCKKSLVTLTIQFKDCIIAIASSLTTGYSMENAIGQASKEMKILYGINSLIYKELENMIRQVELHIPIEKIFDDFASRSDLEEVKLFSEVFQIAKKGGGDLTKIIKSTAGNIQEKIEVKKEINMILSAKKYEQSLMNGIPMFIILYINYASPELLRPMYGNILGVLIMSACLLVYMFAYFLSKKIIEIEV